MTAKQALVGRKGKDPRKEPLCAHLSLAWRMGCLRLRLVSCLVCLPVSDCVVGAERAEALELVVVSRSSARPSLSA